MKEAKHHPYHLVSPSPWPAIGSMSAFLLVIGTILFIRQHSAIVLFAGASLFLVTLIGWWRDVIREAKSEHTPEVRHGFRYGMALFIASEVMFFGLFFGLISMQVWRRQRLWEMCGRLRACILLILSICPI
jgi:cytochrome c oxidase subunit 3